MMSSNTEKTREQILAERQEKKKKKAAQKNQSLKKETDSNKQLKESSKSSVIEQVSSLPNKDEKGLVSCSDSSTVIEKSTNNSISGDQTKGNEGEKIVSIEESKKAVDSAKINVSEKTKVDNSNLSDNVTKSKAQLKAERRAKQEAERARKLEKSQGIIKDKKVEAPPAKVAQPVKAPKATPLPEPSHKVKLFAHLYNIAGDSDTVDTSSKIHPSIVQLGAQYSSKVVIGANARCLALLNALKRVVMDFETPPNQEFSRGLEAEISKSVSYLSRCRPIAVSMVNAVKHLKFQISQTKGNELKCKNEINEWIDTYIREQLEMAAKAICLFVRDKISSGDVILTYGCSSLIQQILISSHNEGINFQVIVADGRPWLEGREMLRKLLSAGIQCTYVFVNGLSFIMPEVTKILLGAHALLANGYVMSRAGSSQIALLAKTYNVPVLVCCETHKFSERVQTDSFVYNELGNPDDLVSNKGCLSKELSKWKTIQYLTPLNLTYDVTPPDLISAVVTEIAVLPCTSVPVILRIKPPDVSC